MTGSVLCCDNWFGTPLLHCDNGFCTPVLYCDNWLHSPVLNCDNGFCTPGCTLLYSRSPNRKFREATDKVGDKLRAYAQKFKDNRERDKGGRAEAASSGRSASAGRSDTIEEETSEDVEAERAGTGVSRAYSLNSKLVTKPLLQSHSSTESTDTVPVTPKSTPTRSKKKLSLKKSKSGDTEMALGRRRGSKRSSEPLHSESALWESSGAGADIGDSPPSVVLTDPDHLLSPIDSPSQDFPFTFPEAG